MNAEGTRAIEQIGLTYKSAKPKPSDIFNDSFLPAAAEHKI
jgi:hypothetical protein